MKYFSEVIHKFIRSSSYLKFTKFQGSVSISLFDFADKVKMPKITKGHNS